MKTHTQTFKENLITLGKEINAKVTYTINGTTTELDSENLASVTPHFKGNILKSVMKQVDIVSDIDIPLETQINVQFGMKYDSGSFEYINFGNYIVYSSEKQEDTNNYKIVAYDKMLYAMKDYEELSITYPCTIKQFIIKLAQNMGLGASLPNDFVNQDRELTQDVFVGLGYTKRDVLDQLAEVTASTICINNEDTLEIRYLQDNINATSTASGSSLSINADDEDFILELLGNTTQATSLLPSGYTQVEYIQSDGNQYIDTGLKGNLNTQVEIRLNKVTNSGQNTLTLFGDNTTNTKAITINLPTSSGNTRNQRFGDKYYTQTTPVSLNTIYTIKTNKTNLLINDIVQGTFNATTSFTTDGNLMLFRCTGVGADYYSGTSRIYYCKIYGSGNTLSRYLIPCYRNSDNVIGMYDTVGNTFYVNKGTGTFTKGANASLPTPEFKVPIITKTGRDIINDYKKNACNLTNAQCYVYGNNMPASLGTDITINNLSGNGIKITSATNSYQVVLSNVMTLKPNTKYTLSFTSSGTGSATDIRTFIWLLNENNDFVSYGRVNGHGNKTQTFTTNSSGKICLGFGWGANSSGSTSTYENIQIEEGASATEFEEYNGKTYEINLGKNLLNLQNNIRNHNGINTTYNDDGSITLNGTATASYSNICADISGVIEYGRTYILSVNGEKNFSIGFRLYYKDGTSQDFNISASGTISRVKPTKEVDRFRFYIYNLTSGNTYNATLFAQLEQDIVSTPFEKYFEPIELCKIGTYQDNIFKGKGYNLFNASNPNVIQGYFAPTVPNITLASSNRTIYIPCKPNTTYTYSKAVSVLKDVGYTYTLPAEGVEVHGITRNMITTTGNREYETFTTDSQAKYIVARCVQTNQDTLTEQQIYDSIMITEGNQVLPYEPYNAKDKWLLHKEIGKVVINGTENYTFEVTPNFNQNRGRFTIYNFDTDYNSAASPISSVCNLASMTPDANNYPLYDQTFILRYVAGQKSRIDLMSSTLSATTSATFKTWLASNNLIVYYVLATPTTTEITNSELIKDLEKPKLLMGLNNIASDSPLNIEYVSDYETIDEDYIKNNRVDFGEKYGPVNSIVLSRSADSDNVYLKDQDSIDENGLCEIKIKNNQVMNDNDRSDYLPEILNKLKGLNYYINDFESIGITYLDLCDKYKVKIGDTKYSCVMFNDEVEIQNGLNELIYTDKPEMSQTDYRKASESDKAEKQTYLIVDKQAQRIDAVVSTQEEFDESLSQLTIDVDGIQTKVELNYDFVREVEHTNNVSSEEMQKEGLIQLSIKGTAISSNYLRLNISNNTQAYVDLPITTILYQDEDTCDELSIENIYNEETGAYEYHTFITKKLDYIDNTIVQRSTSNNYLLVETTTPITTESSEQLLLDDFHLDKQDLGVLDLQIDDGVHTFSINGYNNLQYYLKYIIVNNITSDLVQSRHIISEINQSAEEIQISADKVSLQGKEINLTSDDIVINSNNFSVDKDGNMTCSNAKITGGELDISSSLAQPRVKIREKVGNIDFINNIGGYGYAIRDLTNSETLFGTTLFTDLMTPTKLQMMITLNKDNKKTISMTSGSGRIDCKQLILFDDNEQSKIFMYGSTGSITCVTLTQTSLEEAKKNFEKLNNALDIVKDVDIYKYNFKFEENYDKKHIGFVIGDKYKYRREITNSKNDGAELYSMISVLYKAVQEQQEQIEELKKEIDILKGGK